MGCLSKYFINLGVKIYSAFIFLDWDTELEEDFRNDQLKV